MTKKTLLVSILALLASAMLASASATNWIVTIKATDMDGRNYSAGIIVGTSPSYTDGLDNKKGEPGTIFPPGPGLTMVTASTLISGASKEGNLDMRAPMVGTEIKVWDIHIYTQTNNGPVMDKIKLTVTPGIDTSAPVYSMNNCDVAYEFYGSMVPNGKVIHDASNKMPSSFTFTIDNPSTSFATADILRIVARDDVPEPSSALVLIPGLAGLGLVLRRRK